MRHFNNHVLFDRDLTRQTAAFTGFTFVDVAFFGVKDIAAALEHLDDALSTSTAPAARRRNKNALLTKSVHQLAASRNFNVHLTVDGDLDVAFCNQEIARNQDDAY